MNILFNYMTIFEYMDAQCILVSIRQQIFLLHAKTYCFYYIHTLVPQQRLFSTLHWIKYVIRKSFFCTSNRFHFYAFALEHVMCKKKTIHLYLLYVYRFPCTILKQRILLKIDTQVDPLLEKTRF